MAGVCGGYNLSEDVINILMDGISYKGSMEIEKLSHGKTFVALKPYSKQEKIYIKNDKICVFDGFLYKNCHMYDEGIESCVTNPQELMDFEGNLNDIYGFFSFCMIEENKMILARDYPGICTLYYAQGKNNFAFANDIDALIRAGFENAFYIKPGSKLIYSFIDEKLVCEDFIDLRRVKLSGDVIDQLDFILKEVTGKLYAPIVLEEGENREIAVNLSGGVDSSLVCYYISKIFNKVHAFTIDGKDNEFARQAAEHLGIKNTIISVTDEDWNKASELYRSKPYNEAYHKLANSLFAPNYILSRIAREKGIKSSFSGIGSDELFASYPRHLQYMKDISYATRQIMDDCHLFLLEAEDLAGNLNGIHCSMPFMSREVVEFALSLDDEYKIRNGIEKWVVRKVAENYLPKTVAWREPGPLHVTTHSFERINGFSYYESFYF